jgi:hypothetical protein
MSELFGVSFPEIAFPFTLDYKPKGSDQMRHITVDRMQEWDAPQGMGKLTPIGISDGVTAPLLQGGALPIIHDFIETKGGKKFNLLDAAAGYQGNQCKAVLLTRLNWNNADEYVLSAGCNVKYKGGAWVPDPENSQNKPSGGQVHAEMLAFGGMLGFLDAILGKSAKVQKDTFKFEQKKLEAKEISGEMWLTISMKSMCVACQEVSAGATAKFGNAKTLSFHY